MVKTICLLLAGVVIGVVAAYSLSFYAGDANPVRAERTSVRLACPTIGQQW
jgi:hypothetical protein